MLKPHLRHHFLRPPAASSKLGPNILLSTLSQDSLM